MGGAGADARAAAAALVLAGVFTGYAFAFAQNQKAAERWRETARGAGHCNRSRSNYLMREASPTSGASRCFGTLVPLSTAAAPCRRGAHDKTPRLVYWRPSRLT